MKRPQINAGIVRATRVFAVVLVLSPVVCRAERLPWFEYRRGALDKCGLKESDVRLSARFDRKQHRAIDALRAWKPTRIEWSYIMDPGFIKAVQDSGAAFAGALDTIQFPGPETDGESFDGKPLIAPWMQYFNNGKGVPYAYVNKPATLQRRNEAVRRDQRWRPQTD
jgi:hypothetical protein